MAMAFSPAFSAGVRSKIAGFENRRSLEANPLVIHPDSGLVIEAPEEQIERPLARRKPVAIPGQPGTNEDDGTVRTQNVLLKLLA